MNALDRDGTASIGVEGVMPSVAAASHTSLVLAALTNTQRKVLSPLDVDHEGEVSTSVLEQFVVLDAFEKKFMKLALVGLVVFLLASVCSNVGTVLVITDRAKTVSVSGSTNLLTDPRSQKPVSAAATVQLITSTGLSSSATNAFFETLETIEFPSSSTSSFSVVGWTRVSATAPRHAGHVILHAASTAVPFFFLNNSALTPVSVADAALVADAKQAILDATLGARGSVGSRALAAGGDGSRPRSVDATTVVVTRRVVPYAG